MQSLTEPYRLGLRPDEAAAAIGSPVIFQEMRDAGWIRPVVERHKIVLFDRGDVAKAWARIIAGEQPVKTLTSAKR